MLKFIYIFALIIFIANCSAQGPVKPVGPSPIISLPRQIAPPSPTPPVKQVYGVVFAKLVFEGVVKTSYVRLTFIPDADPQKINYLYIGDRARQQRFPWISQTVRPDYFILDLEPGRYRFIEIAIPVGTSLATEPMNLVFEVESAKGIYLGTVVVEGTRERVKLGGVPLVQPGFEYHLRVLDERAQAVPEFHRRWPNFQSEIKTALLQIAVSRRPGNIPGLVR